MAAPLAGLAVVVTRPLRQQDALAQAFRAAGANAETIPLLAIEPLADATAQQKIAAQLRTLAACQFAIVISQNAAEQMLAALRQQGLVWPDGLPAFAVGSATAALLRAHGIACNSPLQMDSDGLLALPALQAVNGQRGVIFRGLGGREKLAQGLRERGATVDYCELYCRTLPEAAAGQWADWLVRHANRQALICINSRETLDHLLVVDHSAPARDNLTLLVPGARVARAATDAGFARVAVATDATDTCILDTAIHWYTP